MKHLYCFINNKIKRVKNIHGYRYDNINEVWLFGGELKSGEEFTCKKVYRVNEKPLTKKKYHRIKRKQDKKRYKKKKQLSKIKQLIVKQLVFEINKLI